MSASVSRPRLDAREGASAGTGAWFRRGREWPAAGFALFLLGTLAAWAGPSSAASQQFLLKWGGYGNTDGQFIAVRGIAPDPNGQIVVVDNDRCRIQSFSEEGKLLSAWGSYGDGPQQFRGPSDIAV